MARIIPLLLILTASFSLHARVPDTAAVPDDIIPPDSARTRVVSLIRMGLSQIDDGNHELARNTFQKALELAPGDARVHIGLGRTYLQGEDKRIRLFRALDRLFNRDYISRAIGYFERALELEPDNWEAHYWMANARMEHFGRDDLDRAFHHIRRAYRLAGPRKDIMLRMATLHKALGDLENAEEILSALVRENAEDTDPLANLELARISMSRKRYNHGMRYYWAGVQAISTREEFAEYFNDVVMLATREEARKFNDTPPERANQFFREFWLSRDHELGLSPGMRLMQHYRRFQQADSLYRVPFKTRSPAILPVIEYLPDQNVVFDDRGIVLIRHGMPDQRVSHTGEGVHPNETWVYYSEPDDMILHFVALKGSHEYQLVSSIDAAIMNYRGFTSLQHHAGPNGPDAQELSRLKIMEQLYSSRLEVGRGIYFRLLNDPYNPFVHIDEYEQNILSLRQALGTETVYSPYPDRLESYYDLVEFKGRDNGRSRVEFVSGVPGSDISYSAARDGYHYNIGYQLVIYDEQWNQIELLDRVEKHRSVINPNTLMDRMVLSLGEVNLKPGEYSYFVKIQNGRSVSNFNGKITVDSFRGDSLLASQILTARDIFASPADSSRFKRYDLEVYPHPSREFHPSEKMYAYQEIYNLTPDGEGNFNYRLTYSITLVERYRNVFGRVFDTFKSLLGAGPGKEQVLLSVTKSRAPVEKGMVHEDVAIDISANPAGMYQLTIRVEDLNNGGKSFERNTRFYVRQ